MPEDINDIIEEAKKSGKLLGKLVVVYKFIAEIRKMGHDLNKNDMDWIYKYLSEG